MSNTPSIIKIKFLVEFCLIFHRFLVDFWLIFVCFSSIFGRFLVDVLVDFRLHIYGCKS